MQRCQLKTCYVVTVVDVDAEVWSIFDMGSMGTWQQQMIGLGSDKKFWSVSGNVHNLLAYLLISVMYQNDIYKERLLS